MGTRRSCLGVAVLHGLLYAAGGYDGASCLNRYAQTDRLISSVVTDASPLVNAAQALFSFSLSAG